MGAKSAVLGSPAQQHFSLNPLCVGGMVASDCADRRLTPKAIACALRLRETRRMAHPLSRGVRG
jgi:hypothetical protein